MSAYRAFALLLLSTSSSAALAADELKYGPPATWVVPSPIPETTNASADAPVAMMLTDQQIALEPGKVSVYSETAVKIQNGQGLAIGNVSLPWNPATSTVTIHKLVIRRGKEVLDVLAGGQKFQVIRREGNLELAMLDGQLTANIQPEGLRVGDVLNFATTVEMSDPVLKGHVESVFATWNGLPYKSARARLIWPKQIDLQLQKTASLPAPKMSTNSGMKVAEISLDNVEPLLPPKGAPLRYSLGRIAEVSDYKSWSEIADLLIPHYQKAAIIPQSGPLRDEVERIRNASADPLKRAELALDLVQDRVRYVALLMGEGGYVPASAESTWSRRFGDCKAKTALLLGILHELQIDAVPAAVNSRYGDALAGRLPMLSLFDHVLVRASINGKSYWLDGTRTGDLSLDKIEIPSFGWVLPLVPKAELVPLTETPLDAPSMDTVVSIDASAGVFAPAPFKAERILRGDVAKSYQQAIAAMTSAQLEQSLRDYWREIYDYVTISSATFSHDKDRGELKLSMSGEARIDWEDGWYYVPHSGLAYEPDLDRAPGPDQAAPWAVGFPSYDRSKVTIRLPSGFSPGQSKSLTPVKETLAGIEYSRTAEFNNSVFTMEKSERSLRPEITHAEALATQARLKALANEDVYLRVPEGYRITDKDIQAKAQEKPSSAKAFISRGLIFLDKKKYDEAIADFSEANKLAPQDAWPLANRGLAYAWKRDFPAAEKDLAAAEAVQPDNKVAFRARGLVSELKGNLAEALTIYDKILNRDPDDSFVRLRRAGIRMQQERREEALADLNAVIAGDTRNASALAQRAFIAASKEDWAAAEKDLAAALAADPENAAVLATKAMIAMQRRDYASARDLASEALKRDPGNDFARYLHAQLLKRENGGKASMQAFDEAVARDPKDPSALLIRAFANIDEKNFDAAEKDIAAALAIAPAEPRATIASGYLATARGDHKGAIKAYTAALTAAPGDGPVLARRADAYRQNGDYDLAFADTEAALKVGMISPSLRLQRVNILVSKGDLAAASTEADKLIAENPTSEFALVAAGKTYAVIGEREKAIATIDKALALNAVPYIYINRADVRAESEREAKIADLDAALKVDPKYEDAMAAKASLLSKSGKHAEAIELYDQAIKLALDGNYLKFRRGIALARAGRRAEAEQAFDAERARSKTADDFERQCWAKATNDVTLQAALDDCKTALRLDPDNRGLNETLGMALLKLGKNREAITAYDKAVAEKSGASAFMGRAIARARLGDKDGAHSDAQKARKLRPYIDDTFEGYGLKTTAELADR